MKRGSVDLLLSQYRPVSQLRVPVTTVERARVPAVDAHAHLGRRLADDGGWAVRHPGRVLSGPTRSRRTPDVHRIHFRFTETADEAFARSLEDPPLMGRWTISGLDLPEEALGQVYAGNALKLVPRLA
ncbi:hypothetical protein ACWDLG_38985 [Nonomuraea sp. NPDC003727]